MTDITEVFTPDLPHRPADSHKGTFGTTVLINGCYSMVGAAIICTRAALKSGVGKAFAVIPDSVYGIFTAAVPEAICLPIKHDRRGMSRLSNTEKLKEILKKADSVVIGCGLGQSKSTEKLLRFVIENTKSRLIIDADGINLISNNIGFIDKANADIILTPHPAEMSRLCKKNVKEIERDRVKTAMEFAAEHNVTVVLKGKDTVVASKNGRVYINKTGNSGMATGGSGDALAGIIGAMTAFDKDIDRAVINGVCVHGLAGDFAAEKLSETAMLPTDLIEQLPFVYKTYER